MLFMDAIVKQKISYKNPVNKCACFYCWKYLFLWICVWKRLWTCCIKI